MKYFLKYVLSIICCVSFIQIYAQTYPVTVNAQLIPPYTVYLSDYASPENEKLFVSLLFNDLTTPNYNVRLRLTIEGVGIKIETKPEAQLPAITINSGMLERLGAAELSPYFDANNLLFQGISKQQYQKNAALPEGFYKFCIQAFDYNKNIAVSNKACASAWLILNDPPRINTPVCNSTVKAIFPQNLLFQWLPMHLSSPNISERTSYNFRLVQIIPIGRNPNDAINTSIPIFETTSENSILYYGITEPQLIPGQQYAWRVQAKDAGGKGLFKNNGYSEVCMFTYGEPCLPPVNIKTEIQSTKKVKVSWNNRIGPSQYIVRYKEKENTSASWYENEAYTNSVVIDNLKPGVRYEYEVLSVCEPVQSEYSKRDTFTTALPPGTDDCGKPVVKSSIDKSTTLPTLLPNDVFVVDGFKVRVVSATGSNGTYSGAGVAYIPFLGINVRMHFNNIKINANSEVYEGKVLADKASLEKYRSSIPSPALKNDICQDVSDEDVTKGNTKGDVKKDDTKNTSQDSIKIIIVNGDVKIKPGDTIMVNGKQVIVTNDTEIKSGDIIVVNGKTITVETVSTGNIVDPILTKNLADKIKIILKIIQSENKDSIKIHKKSITQLSDKLEDAIKAANVTRSLIVGKDEQFIGLGMSKKFIPSPLPEASMKADDYMGILLLTHLKIYRIDSTLTKELEKEIIIAGLLEDNKIIELKLEMQTKLSKIDINILEDYKTNEKNYESFIKDFLAQKLEDLVLNSNN